MQWVSSRLIDCHCAADQTRSGLQRDWRGAGMPGGVELLDVMAVSWRALKRHVDGFDGELNQPFDDVWTLRDAVLHIAVWERVAIRRINGSPLPIGESEARKEPWDIDEFNDALLDLWSAVDNAEIM